VARNDDASHHLDMILGDEPRVAASVARPVAGPSPDAVAELRRMALHLETAAVLELRAQRATDPAQVDTLRRRAEQRRRQAARIRARLVADGAAMAEPAPVP
jgi:hypothetical protein